MNRVAEGETVESAKRGARIAERVLIIGLDGATFDVLGPLMDEGRLPRIAEVIAEGASGTLWSTTPPITPAAWTTFLTGKQPGRHGVLDFERYDPFAHRLEFNSAQTVGHVRNLWGILSDHGLRVGSLNVPMTYPAVPVRGFMVSGFEAPGPNSDFVYPKELREEILRRWPDPTLRSRWLRKPFGGLRVFTRNLDYVIRSFEQGVDMTRFLGDRHGWNVLMVVFKLVDNLQHKAWRYIDRRWADRYPARRDLVKAAFEALDRSVGALLDYASAHRATVLIVSDHGHGSLEGKVQPNFLLKEWGYLALKSSGVRSATRSRYLWDRFRGRTRKFARESAIEHDLAVDMDRTRACVMHAGMAGFLYLNLKGRQPRGVVEPHEYETLRDELRERFLGNECAVKGPQGRTVKLFQEVHKPEELYRCARKDQPWLPDLMLIPHESLAVVRRIRGTKPVRWLPPRRIEGTHRPNGIFIAVGPGVRHRKDVELHLADCAPTILAMLGLAVPDDVEGRVATEIFDREMEVCTTTAKSLPRAHEPARPSEPVYTQEELAKVTARLTDLGYLE